MRGWSLRVQGPRLGTFLLGHRADALSDAVLIGKQVTLASCYRGRDGLTPDRRVGATCGSAGGRGATTDEQRRGGQRHRRLGCGCRHDHRQN